MPSGFGSLNGNGPQQVWLSVSLASQNQGGNYSMYNVEVRYYGNGYGSWTNAPQQWSANIGGVPLGGSFTIPQGDAFDQYMVLHKGQVRKNHGSDGALPAFTATATINTDHSSIGDGSVSVSVPAPARLIKGPHVRVSGVWRESVAYVRVAGQWKLAESWVKQAGVWKRIGG